MLEKTSPKKRYPARDVINLTEAAAARIRAQAENADAGFLGLRIGVRNGGCAGMAYAMTYVSEIDPKDAVVSQYGVKVFVEASAVLFLLGTTLDVKEDMFSSGFTFSNPNAISACGCGESVSLVAAESDR